MDVSKLSAYRSECQGDTPKRPFTAAPLRLVTNLTLFICLGMVGCSTVTDDPTEKWSPNRLYQEAKDEANSSRFEKAISLYEKLEGRAAGTILAQQAQIELAYTYHRSGERAKAIATLDRFFRLHPASPAQDYALYLKGTITFADDLGLLGRFAGQSMAERDQRAAKESFQAYRELITRFPDSKYAPDAKQRMVYIINSLAEYEVHVARYYLSRQAYVAAINRAQQAIVDYPDAPALESAMAVLVEAYDALGLVQLRDDAKKIQEKSFPSSAQATKPGASPWWKFW